MYTNDEEKLYEELSTVESSHGSEYEKAIIQIKKQAEEEAIKNILMAEKVIEDSQWSILVGKFANGPLDHGQLVKMVIEMRKKGVTIPDAETVLEVMTENAREKIRREEREKAASIPKPEAYGSWA